MRTPIIAGNWKMYKTPSEAVAFVNAIKEQLSTLKQAERVVCPPYLAIPGVSAALQGTDIAVGAQDLHWEEQGAYTSQVAPAMLKGLVQYVIIGHSERRKYFHEEDQDVNLKVKKALMAGLKPIMCVGETDEERVSGITRSVIDRQVKQGLSGVEKIDNVVIAYEPVWAIGTGKVATPVEAEEVHQFIRGILKDLYGSTANDIRILYGGSVTKDNIGDLIAMEDIDGALVGGASLKADGFLGIIQNISGKKSRV